jgi:hypothetical protein
MRVAVARVVKALKVWLWAQTDLEVFSPCSVGRLADSLGTREKNSKSVLPRVTPAALSNELTEAITKLVSKYHDESAPGGRAHRLVVVAHPMPQISNPKEPS